MRTSKYVQQAVILACCLFLSHLSRTEGQGRLLVPLGRSSVWRAGMDTPKNYDDHMLECGGYWYKKKRGDQCGLCGDAVDQTRDNEEGGQYDTGIITGSYTPGQQAQLQVVMMNNQGGYMEFKVCPSGQWFNQRCLDQHPVSMADGSGTRFYLPEQGKGEYTVDVIMPTMACQRCVMQWTYTGNKEWGIDAQGTQCQGCGPQYQLKNCADISISFDQSASQVPAVIQKYNQVHLQQQNRSPYSPPPAGSNSVEPWINTRPRPQVFPSLPQTNHNSDPWTNPRRPTVNRSPPRKSIILYVPPPSNPDPPTNSQTQGTKTFTKGADPWTNPSKNNSPFRPQNLDLNQVRNGQGRSDAIAVPWVSSQNTNKMGITRVRNNPNLHPWVIPQNPNTDPNTDPNSRDNPDPWLNQGLRQQQKKAADPWGTQGGRERSLTRQTPGLRCVGVGKMGGMEGMAEWCQENCNSDYCPERYCSCWSG